MLIKRFA